MHYAGWKNGDSQSRNMLRLSVVLVSLISFHSKSRQDILYEILYSVTRITNQGGQVTFVWVPAHIGVKGDGKVDKVAKKALKKEKVDIQIRISKAEVKCIIWEKVTTNGKKCGIMRGKGDIYTKFKRVSK